MNNMLPTISWIPVRLFSPVLVERSMTVEDWLRKAADYGLEAVEIYHPFLHMKDGPKVEEVRTLLRELGLKVSMVTTSPDFTHYIDVERKRHYETVKLAVRDAALLGATAVRCTTGQAHPYLTERDGLAMVSRALLRLAIYAQKHGVLIAVENHFRDRMVAELPDFAQKKDVFLKLVAMVEDSPVAVNLDCSNPLMVDENALDILPHVKHKLASVHASDRNRGAYVHSPIGEGEVDYPGIFQQLAEMNYSGWISIEDGQPEGDEGFERSLKFVRDSIARYWTDA